MFNTVVTAMVLGAYAEIKLKHPELPSQLRQFQVACGDSCVTSFALGRHFEQSAGQGGCWAPDVRLPHWIWQKLDKALVQLSQYQQKSESSETAMLSSKSLPMLLLGLLMVEGG